MRFTASCSFVEAVLFFSSSSILKNCFPFFLQQPQLAHRLPASRGPPPAEPQRPFRARQHVIRSKNRLEPRRADPPGRVCRGRGCRRQRASGAPAEAAPVESRPIASPSAAARGPEAEDAAAPSPPTIASRGRTRPAVVPSGRRGPPQRRERRQQQPAADAVAAEAPGVGRHGLQRKPRVRPDPQGPRDLLDGRNGEGVPRSPPVQRVRPPSVQQGRRRSGRRV